MEKIEQMLYGKMIYNKILSAQDKMKVKIGIEILLHNILKIILLFSVSVVCGIFIETIVLITGFSLIRKYAFGIHAKSSANCITSTLLIFPLGAFISRVMQLGRIGLCLFYLLFMVLLYKYAPSDTAERPLIHSGLRRQLRNKSLTICLAYGILSIIIPFHIIRNLLLISVGIEIGCIHPMTYKILKRRYKNYEAYEG